MMTIKRNREKLEKYSGVINILIFVFKVVPKFIFKRWIRFIRNHDNIGAMLKRYIFLKKYASKCGDNVGVFSNVYLFSIENLEIGNNVSIHPMCYIDASGRIEIGNDVSIAHSTTILSEEHKYDDVDVNIKDQGVILKKTIIDNNVWIGSGVKVLAGSHIESGCIIAAGAVVKGNIKRNSIVGGVPAVLIKERMK